MERASLENCYSFLVLFFLDGSETFSVTFGHEYVGSFVAKHALKLRIRVNDGISIDALERSYIMKSFKSYNLKTIRGTQGMVWKPRLRVVKR